MTQEEFLKYLNYKVADEGRSFLMGCTEVGSFVYDHFDEIIDESKLLEYVASKDEETKKNEISKLEKKLAQLKK